MSMHQRACALSLSLLIASFGAARGQEVVVKVGAVRSISTVAILWAAEQGYFRQYGIKVATETLDTASNSIALLAQNQLQIVEGGISAGYFNALEKNLPITMVLDRVSSPLGHNLMLRPDLKDEIKELPQLRGRRIATNGHGAVSTYEVGKLLETAGLTISDVDAVNQAARGPVAECLADQAGPATEIEDALRRDGSWKDPVR